MQCGSFWKQPCLIGEMDASMCLVNFVLASRNVFTGLKVLFTIAGHTLPNATLHMEWNAMHAAEAALALNHQAACCDLLKHDISIHIYHGS